MATHDGDHLDSGLGSSQTELTKEKQPPFEAFLAARKLSVRMYAQRAVKRRRSQHGSSLPDDLGRDGLALTTKPVLQMEALQPAVTFKSHALGPRLQLWCYDISLMGCQLGQQGWLHKSLPEASDFNIECLRTRPGLPDLHTGVMPSFLAVDVRYLTNGAANSSIDVGRPVQVSFNVDVVSEVTKFLSDISVQSDSSSAPAPSIPATSPVVKYINLTTREISLEVSAGHGRDDYPKLSVTMLGNSGSIRMRYGDHGKFPRLDANLEVEGLEISFIHDELVYNLLRPLTMKCELEMVSSPHSLTQTFPSLPQICCRLDIGFLQIDFGQHHLHCITALSKVLQAFLHPQNEQQAMATTLNNETTNENYVEHDQNDTQTEELPTHNSPIREEADLGFELLEECETDMNGVEDVMAYEVDGVKQSTDDLRTGPFKYVMISGEVGLHHPEPYEILFTSDTRDRPPTMSWRYPEPRALATIEVLPLPFSSPVLVNTINMGDELRVPCVLSYWDNLQKCYVVYKEFYISEVSSCHISLPDPLISDPATVIVAEEWQMTVDASTDIDYPDDSSFVDEDSGSSYSSPYRSLISATSLAASVKVNSVFSPSLIPAVSAQFSVSAFEIKILNHENTEKQVLPKPLVGYTLDPSVPTEQEFLLLTIEGLSGVTKHLGGKGAATLCHVEWNCHCELLDYGDLTYKRIVSPFDVSITGALFHGTTEELDNTSSQRSAWLEAAVNIGHVESVVSQSTVHTAALAVEAWTKQTRTETILFSHYVICNDTNEDIRLGQVDTDESILLASRHVLPYSWRTTRAVNIDPKLHVCFESEGDWRWSEPFDTDNLGVCARTIHHKLHSAVLIIDVIPLSGVQKQVIFRGGLQITSRLSVGVDLQILKNPTLGSGHTEKTPFQVHEDLSLAPNTTLPSYIVSHAGLVGMRIRIPNTTTWSEALPLDFAERKDDSSQHSVVKLLGVKTFQTFYLWYSVDKKLFEQVQITLSPLFIMRSHLPDPVLMNVFSAKTGSSSALEVLGKGREEQVLVLPPNSWHHLKFQFDNDGKTSDPSVPLNSTLIDLANKVNPDACDEEDRPLDTIWPYCGFVPKEKEEREPVSGNASFVRHVVSSVSRTEATVREGQTISQQKVAAPFPDIELQCRVVKKWRHLSTLIVDVIPWCLLVNKTIATFYLRDLDTKVEIEVSSGQTIAPYKFKDQIQFGAHVAGSTSVSWSNPLTFLSSKRDKDASTQPTDDGTHHVTISIAHVTRSARPLAVTWVMTSRLCCGVHVVCVEEKYCVVNSTTRPLMVLPALGASGKKIPCEVLQVERAIPLPANDTVRVPIAFWDVTLTSSVVLDEEGVASLGDTTPVVFLALEEEFLRKPLTVEVQSSQRKWSTVFPVSSEAPRSAVSIPVRSERSTLPLIVTTKEMSGVTCIVIAVDTSPRLTLYNDCPFTLQFGQTTPPQSPTYRPGSPEKVVVVEQMDPLFDVPEIPALSSMHYELPMMREWFNKPGDVQPMPNIHIQALYNVTVEEISEDAEARVSHGQTTEVPQGWSHGFDISSAGHVVVNLPGRGRAIIFVSKSRLCTIVRVKLYEESTVIPQSPCKSSPRSCELTVAVSKLDICLVNTHCKSPVEVLRATACGLSLCNSPSTGQSAYCELSLRLASFQLDNQLDGELFEFPVIVTTSGSGPIVQTPSRKHRGNNDAKPFLLINLQYEPSTVTGPIFLQSVVVTMEPVTVFLEDTLVYRLVGLAESFLPPQAKDRGATNGSSSQTKLIVNECTSIINPLIIGQFTIKPLTIHLTLHASVKLFVAMDDTSLSLNQFYVCPVFAPGPTFAQRVFYHYLSSVIFKVGWVVGSLELLGSPAGLIRNFSRGLADFFYLPYDGLTRGPGAFVTGMSQGVSSFVRHVSTGALTSVTNLASSISRNLDRLCMDQDHIRLQEEQRCRRPTRLVTGIAHGLGGFGLSLLGAVAGVVDQPIQGIQRANDVREAATGVLTGVGKGLLGVVTKPIGGAMELVSQTGQGILRGTGLSHLPSRLHPVEESLVIESRNSQLKYSWKVLHLKTHQNLVLCIDATIVTTTGHDYSGALLLTSSTLYIASSAVDSIQQSLHVANTDLQYDDEDNRLITVTTLLTTTNEDDQSCDIPDTGDRERMEQFLRDAHAYAQGSHCGSTVDESPGSFLTSKFVLLIDPVLRETVLAQFKTVKSKLLAETRLRTESIVT